jgi:uridylate kinase
MLDREQAYYEAHKEELLEKYTGKKIIIAEDSIKGVYDTDGQAYRAAVQTMKLESGTFMIKDVTATDQESIQRYMTRVYV